MQGTNGFDRTKDSVTSSWSLAFIILAILISLSKYYVCTYKLEQLSTSRTLIHVNVNGKQLEIMIL
jgi:hypothetical protein